MVWDVLRDLTAQSTNMNKMIIQKAWEPTLVLLPGESRGQRSLAGYSL